MPNPGQPTIALGATGPVVRRAQRALRRASNLTVTVDGVFGPRTEAAVRQFQAQSMIRVDGIVGPVTWRALPDGAPMPLLRQSASGDVVRDLQRVLTDLAPGRWNVTPQGIDGDFGEKTKAAVMAFQRWGQVAPDGVVGDLTWSVELHTRVSTLEAAVGLQYILD